MTLNINKVMLAGNLTRDPQCRTIANERTVADFGMAINRRYKDKSGEKKEETTFVDVECWGSTAENVGKYLTKGSPCYVEGYLKLDSWDDKESGQKRSKIKIVADTVQFLGEAAKAPVVTPSRPLMAPTGATAFIGAPQRTPPKVNLHMSAPKPPVDDDAAP